MHLTATTWGITSTQFLAGYGALCVAAAAVIWWQWRGAIGPKQRSSDPLPELGLYELAMLGGGPQLAITSALTKLHRDKQLRVRRRAGTFTVADRLEPTADPVERAVIDAVRLQPGISAGALRSQLARDEALRSIAAQLTQRGLVVEEQRAGRVGRLWLVGVLLAALGIARIVAQHNDDAAVGGPIVMVLLVAVATFWLAGRRPLATRRGREVLGHRRAAREDLRRHPVTTESAMTVALFGGGALWLADPAIASALGVPREEEGHGGIWGGARGNGCSGGGGGACGSGVSVGDGGGGGGGGGCGGGGG